MPEGASGGIYEITIKGNGSENLVFNYDKLGIYTYTITQIGCDNDDCYHDKVSTYELTVSIVNAENPAEGRFDCHVALRPEGAPKNDKRDEIIFTNKYAAPAQVIFSATKIYNNKTPKTGLFEFVLKNGNGKVLETVSNVGKDVTFSPIVFDKVGTYTYKISEVIGNRAAVIYDKSIYTATVSVTRDVENEGDYVAAVTYKKGSKVIDADAVKFINRSETGGLPFTGDQFRMALWGGLMVGSLVAIVVLLIIWKKRKK